jgi:hypothetical protein
MKSIKKQIKSLVLTGLAGISAIMPFNSRSSDIPHGRAEISTFNQKEVFDLKAAYRISDKLSTFGRARTSIYNNTEKVIPFAFVDLDYSIGNGFDLMYETQFIDSNKGTIVTPRPGIEYFKKIEKDLTFFTSGTANIPTQREPKPNGEIVANLRYSPELFKNSKIYGVAQLETCTNFSYDGLNFATQRIRIGLGKKGIEAGIAFDFSESNKKFSHLIGGFIGYGF